MSLEVELGFEGLIDRLDDLAERLEEASTTSWSLRFQVRPDECDSSVVEFGLETGSPVALVRDQRGAFGVQAGERDHVEAGVAFIGFGPSQRERQRQTAGRGDQMQSQSPEEP